MRVLTFILLILLSLSAFGLAQYGHGNDSVEIKNIGDGSSIPCAQERREER